MRFIKFAMLILLACYAGAGAAQPLAWVQGLETAQELSKRTNNPLLLFFSARESAYSKNVNDWLQSDQLRSTLANVVLVRSDIDEHQQFANQLGVYRAGTVMIYRSTGEAVAQIADVADAEELNTKVSAAVESAHPKEAVAETPAADAAKPTAPKGTPYFTTNSVYLELPKGKQVGDSVIQPTTSSAPIRFGPLENGKSYVLQMKGVFTTRKVAENGSDPLYNFILPESPQKVTKSTFVRFVDHDVKLSSYFSKIDKPMPSYTLAHTYDVPITGDGKELVLQFHESNERNYTDNDGSIALTLFEGK